MVKNVVLKTEYVENEKICNLTTYKTEGEVCGAFYPKSEWEMTNLIEMLHQKKLPYIVVGKGSNLLISPNASIFVVSTKKLRQKLYYRNGYLYVSASTPLGKVYNYCLTHSLLGFEALALIPGSMGGAIKMNASCFGSSIFDNLVEIKVCKNGKIFTLKKSQIEYGYRFTKLNDFVILSAKFAVNKGKTCEIKRKYSNYLIKRTNLQPKGLCCGSIFKNPPCDFAGRLIEECGLKGLRKNDALISPKHANFIINSKNAKFEDIKCLIDFCKIAVQEKFNISLVCEVEIVE